MKKVALILIKIGLFFFFLHNIGIFSINYSALFPHFGESMPFNASNQRKLNMFMAKKIKTAEKKGEKYSPFDYFRDLHEIKIFSTKLRGTMGCMNETSVLQNILNQNLNARLFSGADINQPREHFRELENPGITAKEKKDRKIFQKTWWPNLKSWLLRNYLKNFPLAFILFLLWWYEENKKSKISNPISFIIAVIFYPVIIAILINEYFAEKGRNIYAEAMLRSVKGKMFSLLSKNELEDIKRFAKSGAYKIDDWKKYLENQGLEPRKVLVTSLVITILFTIIPKFSFTKDSSELTGTNIFTTQTTSVVFESPPNNYKMCHHATTDNQPVNSHNLISDYGLDNYLYNFSLFNFSFTWIREWTKQFHPQEVILKIEHVPHFSF